MHPLTLWLSQVDCAVITSPEDPGEESFQEAGEAAGRGGGGGFMLCRHRRGLLPLQTKRPIRKQARNARTASLVPYIYYP